MGLLTPTEIATLKERARTTGDLTAKIYADLQEQIDRLQRAVLVLQSNRVQFVLTGTQLSEVLKGEDLSTQITGSSKEFQCSRPYVAGTLLVWVDALLQYPGTDYVVESDPNLGKFTTTTEPIAGTKLVVSYVKS